MRRHTVEGLFVLGHSALAEGSLVLLGERPAGDAFEMVLAWCGPEGVRVDRLDYVPMDGWPKHRPTLLAHPGGGCVVLPEPERAFRHTGPGERRELPVTGVEVLAELTPTPRLFGGSAVSDAAEWDVVLSHGVLIQELRHTARLSLNPADDAVTWHSVWTPTPTDFPADRFGFGPDGDGDPDDGPHDSTHDGPHGGLAGDVGGGVDDSVGSGADGSAGSGAGGDADSRAGSGGGPGSGLRGGSAGGGFDLAEYFGDGFGDVLDEDPGEDADAAVSVTATLRRAGRTYVISEGSDLGSINGYGSDFFTCAEIRDGRVGTRVFQQDGWKHRPGKHGINGRFTTDGTHLLLTPVFKSGEWKGRQRLIAVPDGDLIEPALPRGLTKATVLDRNGGVWWLRHGDEFIALDDEDRSIIP